MDLPDSFHDVGSITDDYWDWILRTNALELGSTKGKGRQGREYELCSDCLCVPWRVDLLGISTKWNVSFWIVYCHWLYGYGDAIQIEKDVLTSYARSNAIHQVVACDCSQYF